MKKVTFKNGNIDIAAHVYLPADFSENKKYPVIICGHPIGSCKDQTAGAIYGKSFAENGFIALAFDASHQGESGGLPRSVEDAATRVEDFRCAVDYLVTLSYVDENRIGLMGMCGGGGYSVTVTMTDRRIKALGTVTGVNFGRLLREGFGSGRSPIELLEDIAKQRTKEARGSEPKFTQILPASPSEAEKMGLNVDTARDVYQATEYYKTSRGQSPNGITTYLDSHLAATFTYDALAHVETLLTQPLQVVVGDLVGEFGAYRDGLELYNRAASKRKNLLVVKGASHYDLYWKPEAVKQALDKLIPFFKESL